MTYFGPKVIYWRWMKKKVSVRGLLKYNFGLFTFKNWWISVFYGSIFDFHMTQQVPGWQQRGHHLLHCPFRPMMWWNCSGSGSSQTWRDPLSVLLRGVSPGQAELQFPFTPTHAWLRARSSSQLMLIMRFLSRWGHLAGQQGSRSLRKAPSFHLQPACMKTRARGCPA